MLVLRTHKPVFRSMPSKLLLGSTVAVVAATFSIPLLGALTSIFRFVPLSTLQLTAIIAIVFGYIVASELTKAWYFRSESSDIVHWGKVDSSDG